MEVFVGSRSKRQGSIDPWGPGRWRVRLSYGAEGSKRQRLSKVIRGTKEDAQRYLNAAIRRREQNEPVVLSREAFGVWTEEWLKTWCNALAPRTRADQAGIFKTVLDAGIASAETRGAYCLRRPAFHQRVGGIRVGAAHRCDGPRGDSRVP